MDTRSQPKALETLELKPDFRTGNSGGESEAFDVVRFDCGQGVEKVYIAQMPLAGWA